MSQEYSEVRGERALNEEHLFIDGSHRISSDSKQLISLKNILETGKTKEMELYKMLDLEESSEEYQILLVKRMSVTFDNTEC